MTVDGVVLSGETDVFGTSWDSKTWSADSAAGSSWSGTSWSGTSWTGSAWTGDVWAGLSWAKTAAPKFYVTLRAGARLVLDMRRHKAISELQDYASSLLVEEGSATEIDPRPDLARPPSRRWRSPAVALASAGLMVFGNIGMAAAVDSAVPGDLLYPIDRAYESMAGLVGIDTGGRDERIQEASVLLDRGELDRALESVAEAVADIDAQLAASLRATSPDLAQVDRRDVKREELHSAIAALVDAARGVTENATGTDRATQLLAVTDRVRIVAEVTRGGSHPGDDFTPPGQDDSFTPPGQDDSFTPPGQDEKLTPPGQDDNFTPPGQDDNFTPPGQDDK